MLTAVPIFMLVFVVVFLPAIVTMGLDVLGLVYRETVAGFITGLAGSFAGWRGGAVSSPAR